MRMNPLAWILAVLALGVATTAHSEETGDVYLTTMISYLDDDKDRGADDGLAGLHFGAGWNFDKWTIEGNVTYFRLDEVFISPPKDTTGDGEIDLPGNEEDQYQIGGGIDVIRRFGDSERVVPYALVGAGYLHTDKEKLSNEHGGMLSAAAGMLWPIRYRNISLRSELRVRKDYGPSDTLTDWMLSFGIQVPYGKDKDPDPSARRDIYDATKRDVFGIEDDPKPVPPESMTDQERKLPSQEDDSDGDGVIDWDDMCGGTKPGVEVDKFGCALKTGSDRADHDETGT